MKLIETLKTVAWAEYHFGSLVTGGNVKMRDIKAAKAKQLVKSIGDVVVLDADGFQKEPERYREGFQLTQQGVDYLWQLDPEAAEHYNVRPSSR